jgi:hypothetical protein
MHFVQTVTLLVMQFYTDRDTARYAFCTDRDSARYAFCTDRDSARYAFCTDRDSVRYAVLYILLSLLPFYKQTNIIRTLFNTSQSIFSLCMNESWIKRLITDTFRLT